ncbi:MAG: hypothetical protein ACJAVI_006242 [Candidatus Azotimanducaceae bacterium]
MVYLLYSRRQCFASAFLCQRALLAPKDYYLKKAFGFIVLVLKVFTYFWLYDCLASLMIDSSESAWFLFIS